MNKIVNIAILSLCMAQIAASEAPDPMAEGLKEVERFHLLLERIQYEQSSLRTLEARFTLVQESEMLEGSEELTGQLLFSAPEQIRWEYLQPKPLSVVINGDEMVTWYKDLGRAETMRVGRYSDRILRYFNATNSLESLLEYFEARVRILGGEEGTHRIELLPKYKRIAKRIASIVLWIHPETYLPARVRIEAADGGVSDYRFQEMKVNVDIPDGSFDLALPEDVEIHAVDLSSAAK